MRSCCSTRCIACVRCPLQLQPSVDVLNALISRGLPAAIPSSRRSSLGGGTGEDDAAGDGSGPTGVLRGVGQVGRQDLPRPFHFCHDNSVGLVGLAVPTATGLGRPPIAAIV